MMKTIVALFAFYELSTANRLLLQTTAPANTAAATSPATTAAPQIITQAPATPIMTLPPLPIPGSGAAAVELLCVEPNGVLGSCARTIQTVVNPVTDFKVKCSAYGACYGTNFQIGFGNPGVGAVQQATFQERLGLCACSEPYSCYHATMEVKDYSMYAPGSVSKYIDRFECKALGACDGLTIKLWGVSMNDMDCTRPEFCMGCTIEDMLTGQVKPCFNF